LFAECKTTGLAHKKHGFTSFAILASLPDDLCRSKKIYGATLNTTGSLILIPVFTMFKYNLTAQRHKEKR
jgi:hypothetical protein